METKYKSLDHAWNLVKQFHITGKHPVSELPKLLDEDRVYRRASWLDEEVHEFINAKTLVDQTDALIDLMYFALGTFVEMGVQPAEAFEIVHSCNMEKVKNYIVKKDDTKIGKPEGWVGPEPRIEEELNKQLNKNQSTQLTFNFK